MIKNFENAPAWARYTVYVAGTVCTAAFIYFILAWIFVWPLFWTAFWVWVGAGIIGAVIAFITTRTKVTK